MTDAKREEIIRRLQGRLDELKASAVAVLNTTPNERQNPAVWFPRIDRLKAAIAAAHMPYVGGPRCDECDNGIRLEWPHCPWCGTAIPRTSGEEKP